MFRFHQKLNSKLQSKALSQSGLALSHLLVTLGVVVLVAIGCFVWLLSKPAETRTGSKSPDSHKTHSGSAGGSSLEESHGKTNLINPNNFSQRNIESSRSPEKSTSTSSTAGELQGAESTGTSLAGGQTERAMILEKVHVAAVTYDPASLPVIEPYLNSPDPEVRIEAMNAVVTLGDAAGAPLLRAQAAKESDEARKKELLDNANWLELPPAKLVLPKKKPSPTPTQR